MLCPFCGHDDSKVIDSRNSVEGIRRRRECLKCTQRFTTQERLQTRALMVIKRDDRREEFSHEKLFSSLLTACAKRPLPTGTIEKLVTDIEAELAEAGRAEIPSRMIGEMVMERLKALDRVAYIRFASVYRDFRHIETFKEAIDALLEPPEEPAVPDNQLSFLDDEPLDVPPRRRRRRARRPSEPGVA